MCARELLNAELKLLSRTVIPCAPPHPFWLLSDTLLAQFSSVIEFGCHFKRRRKAIQIRKRHDAVKLHVAAAAAVKVSCCRRTDGRKGNVTFAFQPQQTHSHSPRSTAASSVAFAVVVVVSWDVTGPTSFRCCLVPRDS